MILIFNLHILLRYLQNYLTIKKAKILKKHYLGLGKLLNIEYDELIDAYYKKNEINFNRIKQNY